jgi:hypothetical protein
MAANMHKQADNVNMPSIEGFGAAKETVFFIGETAG